MGVSPCHPLVKGWKFQVKRIRRREIDRGKNTMGIWDTITSEFLSWRAPLAHHAGVQCAVTSIAGSALLPSMCAHHGLLSKKNESMQQKTIVFGLKQICFPSVWQPRSCTSRGPTPSNGAGCACRFPLMQTVCRAPTSAS